MIANTQTPPSQRSVAALKEWAQAAIRFAMDITHNSIALVGLAIAALTIVLVTRDDLRDALEHRVLTLLLERQEAKPDNALLFSEPQAVDRVTAAQPSDLPKPQR